MTAPRTAIVAGLMNDGLGLAEAARGIARALRVAGLDVAQHSVPLPGRPSRFGDPGPDGVLDLPEAGARDEADLVVVCLNPPELDLLRERSHPLPAGRRLVGVWAYEVDKVPAAWSSCRHRFDELWVNGNFMAEVLAPAVNIPVHVVPPAVSVAGTGPMVGACAIRDQISGPYLLTLADARSDFERKNTSGAVDAYLAAFGPDDGQHLVVKVWGGDHDAPGIAALRQRVAHRSDVTVLDQFLPRSQFLALLGGARGLVAIHRAEGFGLHLLEAALLGVPVVTSDCGGPAKVFDEFTAWMVPVEPCPVPARIHHYPNGAIWHEPDLPAAVAALRDIVEGGAAVTAKVAASTELATRTVGIEATAAATLGRLKVLFADGIDDDPRGPLPPKLTIVAGANSAWPHAEPLIQSVAAQLASTDTELVLALGHVDALPDGERVKGVRRILVGNRSPFELRAAAIAATDSDVLLVTEEHVRLGPRTVEAYIDAMPFDGLAAGPVDNGSTTTRADWANYLLGFSMWASPLTRVPTSRCPTIANVAVARAEVLVEGAPPPAGHLERHILPQLWKEGRIRLVPDAHVEHVQSRRLLRHAWAVFHDARTAGAALRTAGVPNRSRLTPVAVRRSAEKWLRDLVVLLQDRPELWPMHRRCRWHLRALALAKAFGLAVGARRGAGRSALHLD